VTERPAAILDVDGTLVDTNYHHVLAWYRAFRQHGVVCPTWRLHRHLGMGGDTFVPSVAGEEAEREHGDDIRSAHDALFMSMIDEVDLLPGARDLLLGLRRLGVVTVLASSARQQELDHYLVALDGRGLVDGWTTSGDVERTKPHPDVIEAALEKAGTRQAVVVGDSPWDCVAAARAGIPSIAVRSGGFAESVLREAGASMVFDDAGDLAANLERTPFAG
jgi:HAD superfamily hydrolase (TIGR01509 family)